MALIDLLARVYCSSSGVPAVNTVDSKNAQSSPTLLEDISEY